MDAAEIVVCMVDRNHVAVIFSNFFEKAFVSLVIPTSPLYLPIVRGAVTANPKSDNLRGASLTWGR